ncbi:MAG TPA: tetratricopeptide repeat protein, partial [Syntrophales bacterium]|nr:tetratricopeptide repeat protein [Syntrophales bacterium]
IAAKRPEWKIGIIGICVLSTAVLFSPARAQIETWQNSITLFEQALHVTKNNPIAQCNIGAHYLNRGDCEQAVPHFLKSLEMKRDFAPAYYGLAVCDSRGGNVAGAINYFGQAILIEPRSKMARLERGQLLMQHGRLEESVEDFRLVLEIDPENEIAHVQLGLIFLQQGKWDDAETHFSEALRANERSGEVHNNIGILRAAQGRMEEAIASFLKAQALMPGNLEIENNLRIVQARASR